MERLVYGKLGYGCKHYRRRCNLRAPCCDMIVGCRYCHNELKTMLKNPSDRHHLVRSDVKHVICSVCDTSQPVAQVCSNCGVNMGEYFCNICKFYDDDTSKGQFHCNACGICRVGGRENYSHCNQCGLCYSIDLLNKHSCVDNSMREPCTVCYEDLFDSLKNTTVMACGHSMHSECHNDLVQHRKFSCPLCRKPVTDMSMLWKRLDKEIAATMMPENDRQNKVWISCNVCETTMEVLFHVIGLKCVVCESYDTRTTSPPVP